MATRPFSGCRCACSSPLTTVVVLQLPCKLGTPRFPALRPPRLMQLPFLLAFLSLLSLAHFHLLSTAAAEEVSISPKLFIYETVSDSFIRAASDSPESSFLHTNLPKEEHDHILIADDGVHKMVPTPAEPFRYDSVAASLRAGASCTQGRHVQSGNVQSSFTHEAAAGASHQTTAREENIWQITRASMHLEADHHQSSHLGDHTRQEKNSFLLRDSGNHMQSDAKREDPVITEPSTVYESVGTPIRSGAHRSSLLLVNNMENASLLDDGGKQVGKSPSEVASFSKEGGDLLQDSVPQEKYELLRDDGHTVLGSGTQHIDSKSKILIFDSATPQEDHLVDNGGKHVEHTGSLKSSKVEEETFLHDNVPQGEYSLLLGDGVWKELHIKELPSLKDEERKNHIKLPLLRGNLRMVVDDSTESATMKNIAHDQIPEAKVSTSNEDNLKMVVGDSSNWMIEKGNRPQASSTNDSPNVGKLRMVVGDSFHNMIQKGQQGHRGRSRSCSASNSNVCRQLADEEYLNHIVLYGRPRRMRSRQPACCSGTCVDLSNNDIHCGICGLPCHLLETCCNGKCVKLDTDDSNCGECGNACPTSSSCQFGLCGYY